MANLSAILLDDDHYAFIVISGEHPRRGHPR
jgi:hypothetical protein